MCSICILVLGVNVIANLIFHPVMVVVITNKICWGCFDKQPGISVPDTEYVFLCRGHH